MCNKRFQSSSRHSDERVEVDTYIMHALHNGRFDDNLFVETIKNRFSDQITNLEIRMLVISSYMPLR